MSICLIIIFLKYFFTNKKSQIKSELIEDLIKKFALINQIIGFIPNLHQ
jgi:hypothetical protein